MCDAVRFVRLQPASDLVGGAIETYCCAKSSKHTVVLKTFTCLVDTVMNRNICHVDVSHVTVVHSGCSEFIWEVGKPKRVNSPEIKTLPISFLFVSYPRNCS